MWFSVIKQYFEGLRLYGWLTEINSKRSDGSTVMDYQYSFDNIGNITSRNTEGGAYSYNYDDLYRLTGATPPSLPAESFSYDKVGNRLTSAAATNWNYNTNNALVGYNGVNFQYDANGNTTSKDESGQVTNYIYSAKDRLDQVNLPDGKIAVYKYDPFGRRISKTVGGATTYFMYADEGLVAEMDTSGNVIKTYDWKPNSTWGTDPAIMTEGGQTYFYHNDHLGTPQKMTDAAGAIVWSATYTAFGEATVDAASTVTNNLRYPGQYCDAETGLDYNYHRLYDPKTGRYITSDPIGLSKDSTLYSYSKMNPFLYIDPFGLKCRLKSSKLIGNILIGSQTTRYKGPWIPEGWSRENIRCSVTWKKEGSMNIHETYADIYEDIYECESDCDKKAHKKTKTNLRNLTSKDINVPLPTETTNTWGTIINGGAGEGAESGDHCLCSDPDNNGYSLEESNPKTSHDQPRFGD